MKTTIELPDDLFRRAKAEAALRGRKLRELVEAGLRLVLASPDEASGKPSLADLMRPSLGIVRSGVPDLASNPRHMKGFGRDARRHH